MDAIFVVIRREAVVTSAEVVAEEVVAAVVVIVVEDMRIMVDMIFLKRETPGTNNLCLWNNSCSSF